MTKMEISIKLVYLVECVLRNNAEYTFIPYSHQKRKNNFIHS